MNIIVGECLPNWKQPSKEGGDFNIDSGGAILKLGYVNPRPEEVAAFRESPVKIGLVNGGTHTAFLIFNIDGCTDGWFDAPYSLGLVAPENREIEIRDPDAGWLISAIMYNCHLGLVHALRMFTVTPAFSAALDRLVEAQRGALAAFTPVGQLAEIEAAYRRWPTSGAMADDALIIETAGTKFPR